ACLKERQSIAPDEPLLSEIDFVSSPTAELTASIDDVRPVDASEIQTFGLVELLLKNRRRLHRILRDPATHAVVLPRLLAIALMGFVLFGITMSLVLTVANRWPSLTPIATWLEAPTSRLLSVESIDSA